MILHPIKLTVLFLALGLTSLKAEEAKQSQPQSAPQDAQVRFVNQPYVDLTAREKQTLCEKFRGKLLAFYDDVYRTDEKCFRYKLSSEDIYKENKKGSVITEVDGKVIAAFRDALVSSQGSRGKVFGTTRTCKELEGRYVSVSFTEVFLVTNCKKRLFADWATFEQHRGPFKLPTTEAMWENHQGVILQVSDEELDALANGSVIRSVIDEEYHDFLLADKTVDVLPLDTACKGLIGRHAAYLGDLYFIESWSPQMAKGSKISGDGFCRRKIIDAELFTKQHASERLVLPELTSSQALSIPIATNK